jgi:hypothetical protein
LRKIFKYLLLIIPVGAFLTGVTSGCQFAQMTFIPYKNQTSSAHHHRDTAASYNPIESLILSLQKENPFGEIPNTNIQDSIQGNRRERALVTASSQDNDTVIITTFSLSAAASVSCTGGVCDQQILKGPAEIIIKPDQHYISIHHISARNENGDIHLTGRVEQFVHDNPLESSAESSLVMTADSDVFVMDKTSTMFIDTDDIGKNHAQGIFIAGSTAHDIYLSGDISTR